MENTDNLPVQHKSHIPIENGQLKPQDFDGLYRVASIMSESGMVPAAYAKKPAMIFVAVQMGMELGLTPMASVQNIAVINGNPCLWGDAVLGIVSGSGLLDDIEETTVGDYPNDNFKCVCRVIRQGRKTTIIREYSIADAKQAGLFGSNKDNWRKYPKRMLQMRARSMALRDSFPDLLKGIKVREEVMDYDIDMKQSFDGSYAQDGHNPVSEKLTTKPDMSIYQTGDEKQTKPKESLETKKEAQELPDDIKNQINQTLQIDAGVSQKALIQIGRDSIENIDTNDLARAYLNKFNELIDSNNQN